MTPASMSPHLLPAAATFLVALLLSSAILARRQRSPIHWTYLALLAAILFWTGGVIWRFSHPEDAGVRAGMTLTFLGVFAVGPLWLMLSATYTRTELMVKPRAWKNALVFLPSALVYLGFLSNDHHHQFATEITAASLSEGPRSFGGPIFWIGIFWVYALALAANGLLLAHAWRLRGSPETRRGLWLAAAALAPILLSLVYIFRLVPIPYDLTPTGLCLTVSIFYGLLTREGIFDTLPLARRDVLEDLRDGVLLADPGGIVLDANPAALRILQRGPADAAAEEPVVGAPLARLLAEAVGGGVAQDLASGVERVQREGVPGVLHFETDSRRRVELSLAPLRAPHGGPAGMYAVLRDCTDQHRYDRLVRQSQKLESVGVLAAGVAHEVNNPLAYIQANLGSLQQMATVVERNLDRLPEKEATQLTDLREALDESLEGIQRIARIVDRLRRFSRSPDDGDPATDPNAAIEEAIRFARLDREGGWRIEARLADGLPAVRGSRDALGQVLLNLLLNAVQAVAGQPDGRIEIESAPAPGGVTIQVRDNGPGVPAALRENIFDPFFTTKPPDQGTGLGLAIAYDIVREHGGRLVLLEEGPGACFRLSLPRASD